MMQFGVHVRAAKAERFRADLMELAIASALRLFMPEHRAGVPQALRPLVGQVMFDRRAHHAGRAFRAQGELRRRSSNR